MARAFNIRRLRRAVEPRPRRDRDLDMDSTPTVAAEFPSHRDIALNRFSVELVVLEW